MPKVSKNKKNQFSWASIFRLAIFAIVIYFAIIFLSQKEPRQFTPPPLIIKQLDVIQKISHNIYMTLPESSRYALENFTDTPVYKHIDEKSHYLQTLLEDFPGKQIKELKKAIINSLAHELIKSIDNQ